MKLLERIRNNDPQLRQLDLGIKLELGTEILQAVIPNTVLNSLRVSAWIRDANIIVAQILSINSILIKLKISGDFGDEIGVALAMNTSLHHLDLRGSRFRDESLGKALAINRPLLSLCLDRSNIDSRVAIELGQALRLNSTLQTLSQSWNYLQLEGETVIG